MNIQKQIDEQNPMKTFSQSARILIVDDNQEIREVLTCDLRDCGFSVPIMQASSAEEVNKVLVHHHIDLIILDVNLNGQCGLQLLAEIQQKKKTLDFSVMMISGDAGIDTILQSIKIGARDYLIKPWSQKELTQKIYHSLGVIDIAETS